MSLLSYGQKLFSLDTLDTRFISSSKPPANATPQIDPAKPSPNEGASIHIRGGRGQSKATNGAHPPLWGTPEFIVYGVVVFGSVAMMVKTVFEVSQRTFLAFRETTFPTDRRA